MLMILYKKPKQMIMETPSRAVKIIYKLKILDSVTKREIELSEYVRNHIPYWTTHFLPIYEVKTTTVRDIYQQTTDSFRTHQPTNHVLLRYNVRKTYQEFTDFFSTRVIASASSSLQQNIYLLLGDLIHTYQNMINLLYLLKKHSIVFIGLNCENIHINEERSCMLVKIDNGIIYGSLAVGQIGGMRGPSAVVDKILSVNYQSKNAMFYPIEYHFMRYMTENDIYAPSIDTIENVWSEWSKMICESQIRIYFTAVVLTRLKKRYLKLLYPFINQRREKICEYLCSLIQQKEKSTSDCHLLQWNIYGLNISYLLLLLSVLKNHRNTLLTNFCQGGFIEDVLMSFQSLEETDCLFCNLIEQYTESELGRVKIGKIKMNC